MLGWVVIAATLASAGVLGGAGEPPACHSVEARAPLPRGTWLWKHAGIDTEEGRLAIVSNAKRLGLSELYVFLSINASTADLDARVALVRAAEKQGLRISWVMGDPSWAGKSGATSVARALERLGMLRERLGSRASLRVQFDVEPHGLPEWKSAPARVIERYVATMAMLTAGARKAGIEPWLVIPFWFDGHSVAGRPVHEHAIDLADGVVVMAYMNNLETIARISRTETDYADRVGKRVTIAVETKCIQPEKNSYCTRGADALRDDLEALEPILASSPAVEGIAIHDFVGLRQLVQKRPASDVGDVE